MGSLFILLLTLLCCTIVLASHDLCWPHDSDCPPCPADHPHSFTSILPISTQSLNMVEIAREVDRGIDKYPGVQSFDPPLIGLHTSLNYFCCYNTSEREQIIRIMEEVPWKPIFLNYTDVGCNLDHANVTTYIHSKPNAEGQQLLLEFVQSVEDRVKAAGIPINTPRLQSFHCTYARVDADKYPVDEAVTTLKQDFPAFGDVTMHYFIVEDHVIFPK